MQKYLTKNLQSGNAKQEKGTKPTTRKSEANDNKAVQKQPNAQDKMLDLESEAAKLAETVLNIART